ncbi:MAG: DUF885 domain-containing protein [Planctomycetes bacterium]|nr:DUF885 domain-containing protein [Planctomycetota bacterium]
MRAKHHPLAEIISVGALVAIFFAVQPAGAQAVAGGAAKADAKPSSSAVLNQAFDSIQAFRDREDPMEAIANGRPADAFRISDQSAAATARRNKETIALLGALKSVPRDGLSETELLDLDLVLRDLELSVQSQKFQEHLLVIGPLGGPQQNIPQMSERMPFERGRDLEAHAARLEQVPKQLADQQALLEEGLRLHITQPKVILQGMDSQFDAVIAGKLEALRAPFLRTYPDLTPEQKQALAARGDKAIEKILASLTTFRDFVKNKYIPGCSDEIACASLPNGPEWYAFRLKQQTTTTKTPQEIHAIGLAEVARIRAEMLQVIRRTDWFTPDSALASLPDDELFSRFTAFLRSDPRFYYQSAEELLRGYRDVCKGIDAHLPALFGRLPRLTYGVREIPRFMAPSQTTAYYQQGSLDAGNPGWFYANTFALNQRPKYEMIPLALHEAVPGHHLQIALAQELPQRHTVRRDMGFTAFVEGWALYAERLGIEMKLFDDPYNDFGRLLYEMWRSCRLVVDTGMHSMGWSRDKAVAFMKSNTALSELNIEREIDRYISWPGQACAYKLGELEIRRLRSAAEKELGASFDLRAFHDAILGDGALPLDVLEARMTKWIAAKKAAGSAAR